jgi:hypothetical protein
MSKIPIDEQIEAVSKLYARVDTRIIVEIGGGHGLAAALRTLEFVRDHQEEIRYAMARKKAIAEAKGHRAVKNVLEVFPEARIEGVGEAD